MPAEAALDRENACNCSPKFSPMRSLGASDCLKKPVDRDALLSAIAAATSHDQKT
jgi:BarA-like signal transduction histidine kinase